MTPKPPPSHNAGKAYVAGMLGFMRMFVRWLSPSEHMRLFVSPNMPANKAFRLFSAYIFCLFALVLLSLLFITEIMLGRADSAFLPLAALMVISLLSCLFISRTRNTPLPMLILVVYIFAMCAYYIASGKVDEYFLFYYFWVPPLLVFCFHIKLGSLLCLLFFTMMSVFFLPAVQARLPQALDPDFRIRFLSALVCVYTVYTLAELVISRLIASIYEFNQRLEQYSLTDPLTGLGNRRNCINEFHRLHALRIRSGEPFSVIMIDMDYFKIINDTYGHMLGDEVLRFVARTFSESLRQQDSLFRWGGEEFIMLLPGASIEQAEVVAERLRKKVEETPFRDTKLVLPLTASFGVYTVATTQDMEAHMKNVDSLLYHAKASGRNRVTSQREMDE